jgi:hypothetical protein
MSDTGEHVVRIREKLAKAKLIARYREGERLGAFRTAKQSDPQLAAALATDFAEGLRGSLLPSSQRRRAAILSQAADLLRSTAPAKTKDNLEAIAWLAAEAAFAEDRARRLKLAALIAAGVAALVCLTLVALA